MDDECSARLPVYMHGLYKNDHNFFGTFRATRAFLSSPVPDDECHHAATLASSSFLIG